LGELHHEALSPNIAPELLAKQDLNVRFIVDNKDEWFQACPPGSVKAMWRSEVK
jgi:hypothetical protein